MTLTANQTAAMTSLIKSCLDNMCGETLADLQADPYTWVKSIDLVEAGWGQKEAEGTFGSLVAAGLVVDDLNNGFYLDEDWDVLAKFHA